MDILAALASDPTVLPLWAVLAFAAGMYPVGMLFSCQACCRCSYCTPPGELPETVTVTFAGFVDEEQVRGPDLIVISATACHGAGFDARLEAPGGDPVTDAGPMTKIEIESGGIGYAVLGRVEPTVTISGGSGTGAELEVTLTDPTLDACDIPTWGIASVAIASGGDGGTGYVDGEQLTALAVGGVSSPEAVLIARTTLTAPTINATAPIGSDAELTVAVTQVIDEDRWYVSGVTVDDGGSGYQDGSMVAFSVTGTNVQNDAAQAYILTSRSIPTLVELFGGTGTSAVLAVTLAANAGPPATWGISSVTITDGGAGYEDGDFLSVNLGAGDVEAAGASVVVSGVDGSGAITSISIGYGGEYYHDDGVIESVEVYYGGDYWDDDGVIASVEVQDAGSYYEEDPAEPPYVAEVTLVVSQELPSAGSGAVLTAVVDDDTSSATFGQITSVTIEDGGEDYLAWQWITEQRGCCADHYNGRTVVARRGLTGTPCDFVKYFCGSGSMYSQNGRVVVRHNGPGSQPTVLLSSEINPTGDQSQSCNTTYTGPDPIEDCDAFEFVATTAGGATATVSMGGDFDESDQNPDYATNGFPSCNICCRGTDTAPREINVQVTDNRPGGTLGGEYVLEAELFYPYFETGATRRADVLRWAFRDETGVVVQLWMETIATQTRDDYEAWPPGYPLYEPGAPCHSCFVGGAAGGFNILFGDYTYEAPICAPSGSYDLRQGPSGNDFVGLTIEVL
jgi:hypothetical protein